MRRVGTLHYKLHEKYWLSVRNYSGRSTEKRKYLLKFEKLSDPEKKAYVEFVHAATEVKNLIGLSL